MDKTLLITYTPRTGSNTRRLADVFIESAKNKTEITELDLALNPPELLLTERLNAFVKDIYTNEPLTTEEKHLLLRSEEMLNQLLDAKYIIIAYPMYNFSLPATVKAWIDVITQANKTFALRETGFEGLCTDKKALILSTTGFDFENEPQKSLDFSLPLMETALNFIGIQSQSIVAYGLNQYADRREEIIREAENKIEQVCESFFSS
ncbi:MAG: FMN-dependent NADH-azoreductase [Bacteroidia bacterium]